MPVYFLYHLFCPPLICLLNTCINTPRSTVKINTLISILTEGRCRIELLEVTVCSPSPIMAISVLSSEPSARLLTDELWELALMDMEGTD